MTSPKLDRRALAGPVPPAPVDHSEFHSWMGSRIRSSGCRDWATTGPASSAARRWCTKNHHQCDATLTQASSTSAAAGFGLDCVAMSNGLADQHRCAYRGERLFAGRGTYGAAASSRQGRDSLVRLFTS